MTICHFFDSKGEGNDPTFVADCCPPPVGTMVYNTSRDPSGQSSTTRKWVVTEVILSTTTEPGVSFSHYEIMVECVKHDLTEDDYSTASDQQNKAKRAGRFAERTYIVEWLRDGGDSRTKALASQIEEGIHISSALTRIRFEKPEFPLADKSMVKCCKCNACIVMAAERANLAKKTGEKIVCINCNPYRDEP